VPERKSFLLRMDPEVYDSLQRWAADELRSLNAQIEFLLRRSLKDAGRLRDTARGAAVKHDAREEDRP
jgi:hypothetical protein